MGRVGPKMGFAEVYLYGRTVKKVKLRGSLVLCNAVNQIKNDMVLFDGNTEDGEERKKEGEREETLSTSDRIT